MEFVQHLRVLRRRWLLPLVFAVLGAVIGAATFYATGPKADVSLYKATHTLTSSGNKEVNLSQMAALTTEGEVTKRVASTLGGSPAALASQVTAQAQPQLDLLKITAVGPDPVRAVQVANAFAEELTRYQVELQSRQRDEQIDGLQQSLDSLRDEYAQVFARAEADPLNKTDPARQEVYRQEKDDLISESKQVEGQIARIRNAPEPRVALTTVSTAEAVPVSGKAVAQLFQDNSSSKSSKSSSGGTTTQADLESTFASASTPIGPAPRAAAGFIGGLLLGIFLAFGIERLDPRLRTKEDAEQTFGWPVITETPPISRRQRKATTVLSFDQPRSRLAESYRALRSAILFAKQTGTLPEPRTGLTNRPSGSSPLRAERATVIMITSPSPSEGKTTTAANLAAVLGEAGHQVLVINCDFRRPRVHQYLHVNADIASPTPTELPNVEVVAEATDGGEENPAVVVAAQRRLIEQAANRFDFIVLDTAPLLSTNDAAEVLAETDLVILVGMVGRTTKEAADRAAELLDRRNAPVLGVVLVGATDRPASRYYYYGERAGYDSEDVRAPEEEPTSSLDVLQSIDHGS